MQDPFVSIGEPAGTYPPYERGNTQAVWVTEADGVTPAEGKVKGFEDKSNNSSKIYKISNNYSLFYRRKKDTYV